MSPEHQQPDSENTNAEIAFVQQALAAADRSERSSRIIVGVLAQARLHQLVNLLFKMLMDRNRKVLITAAAGEEVLEPFHGELLSFGD